MDPSRADVCDHRSRPQLLDDGLDGGRGAHVAGLVAGHGADRRRDVVGRAIDRLGDRRRRVMQLACDLGP